ncbi:MAG: phosphatidate cytidylyltransferase [Calditrichaeota bacterium]|nr:phosphatidate cytidylyltransferase [Calditrichota bacterium]
MGLGQLKYRVIVAAIGGPVILALAYWGKLPFLIFLDFVLLFALKEFYEMAERKGDFPNPVPGYLFALLITWDFYFFDHAYTLYLMALAVIVVSLLELYRNRGSKYYNVSITVLGIGYLAVLLSFFIAIRELPVHLAIPYNTGGIWILMIFLTVWFGDSVAYFVGNAVGRHKLAPKISPHKTIEGAVGGFLGMLLIPVLAAHFFPTHLSIVEALGVGAICGIFGQYSDLTESMFKRDAGVKDSSNLIPGHGGIFDRFDVLFLISPLIYLYLKYVVF